MNQAEAVTAIYQRWMAQWPGLSSSVPYVFDNDVVDDAATYARVKVTHLDDDQQTLGNVGSRRFTRSALIEVELRAPGNAGRKRVDLLCGHARTIFEAVRFGATGTEEGVITFTASTEVNRAQSTPRHWIASVIIACEYVEVR